MLFGSHAGRVEACSANELKNAQSELSGGWLMSMMAADRPHQPTGSVEKMGGVGYERDWTAGAARSSSPCLFYLILPEMNSEALSCPVPTPVL